jgi:class 3 adenylate cyclase
MESNGEPGQVNISSTTYELIKDKYTCRYRGKINAKNIGEIDMYFVEGETTVSDGGISVDAIGKNKTEPLLYEQKI